MSRLVARIKILPADSETDIDKLINNLKMGIPKGMELKAHAKEPLAFGLNAIVGDFLLDDAEGERRHVHHRPRCRRDALPLRVGGHGARQVARPLGGTVEPSLRSQSETRPAWHPRRGAGDLCIPLSVAQIHRSHEGVNCYALRHGAP